MIRLTKKSAAAYLATFPPNTKFAVSTSYTSGTWWSETYSVNGRAVLVIRREGIGCKVYRIL